MKKEKIEYSHRQKENSIKKKKKKYMASTFFPCNQLLYC